MDRRDYLIERLEQFLPIVERVHGEHHEEIYKVGNYFNAITDKLKSGKTNNLNKDFEMIRKLTNNYEVPDDVCESYESIYEMIEELEKIL